MDARIIISSGTGGGGGGGGGGAVSSVFGRTGAVAAQTGDYSFAQISGSVAPTQMPLFTATTEGAVPGSGGGTVNFLRADGSWSPASGTGGGTVTSVAMTVPAAFTVTGSPITGAGTLALALNSGGGTTNFLRADGTWAAPAGGGTGTVTSVAMTVPAAFAVAGSPITSSGTLALSLNSGGGTSNFLRADGTWAVPPGTGGGGGILPPTTVSGLPAPATAGVGARGFVTDSTSTSFAAIVAGSGINRVPVYSDGTNWHIG
jgi:hypothetical protein